MEIINLLCLNSKKLGSKIIYSLYNELIFEICSRRQITESSVQLEKH